MTIQAGIHDFIIRQGATFIEDLTWQDEALALVDLTGYSARMQVREVITDATPFLDLTSGNEITLGGAAGTIDILLSDTTTAALTERYGVYDLELISATGLVTRLLEGSVTISREVTR